MTSISRRTYAIAAVVLAAVIFVAINIAANTGLTDSKLDLTENGQFTLAEGTKHIIADLKEPVTLRFFYSKKVAADYAQIDAYAHRVRDMLQEYAARSGGKIVIQEVDPEPFTPEEISRKIVEFVRPKNLDWKGDLEIIFQTIESLHVAVPKHSGDWYFTGKYPTPGGYRVVNQAFLNYYEKQDRRAY